MAGRWESAATPVRSISAAKFGGTGWSPDAVPISVPFQVPNICLARCSHAVKGPILTQIAADYARSSQRTRHSYGLQNYPLPQRYGDYPTKENIVEWLECYAKEFGVLELCRFGVDVLKMRRAKAERAEGGWLVTASFPEISTASRTVRSECFHFVVIATGTVGNASSEAQQNECQANRRAFQSSEIFTDRDCESVKVHSIGC